MKRTIFSACAIAATLMIAGCSGNSTSSGEAASSSSQPSVPDSDEQQLFVGDDIAIAQTQYGKVQGFILRGIYNFRGIPYGANTGGENRFMPPKEPTPWNDVLPAVWWGNTAPQNMEKRYANAFASFVDHWNYDDVSEDCLKLNVWTPALDDGGKRPVLVWFHGGGFTNGNAIEQDGYKGENLVRKGNVVFVSVNHRLGPIGYSDFSSVGGEKYANSGNAGTLDMVASLKWVKNNIANFGGDPDNITIMGQSGGGAKVCILTAMPAAKGLIQKVVPLSGSSLHAADQSYTQKIGEAILQEAGLKPSDIDKLQQMPWQDYIALADKAAAKVSAPNGMRMGFSPVADGINIPKDSFYRSDLSAEVPMMICTTFHEWGMSRTDPKIEAITKEEAIERMKASTGRGTGLGDKAEAVYDAYSKVFENLKPIEVLTLASSNRKNVVAVADAKSKQQAPVYVAWFGWEPPLFNKRMRAFHCSDICFWFANTDLMLTHTGGGKRPRVLSDMMSDALLNFMKTGNPNGGSLPEWPAYTTEKGEVMVLTDTPKAMNDPDRAARQLLP